MTEGIEAKGRRYLCEGRVSVLKADGPNIMARVRGNGASWCTWRDVGWGCDCPARTRCSHIVAVELIAEQAW